MHLLYVYDIFTNNDVPKGSFGDFVRFTSFLGTNLSLKFFYFRHTHIHTHIGLQLTTILIIDYFVDQYFNSFSIPQFIQINTLNITHSVSIVHTNHMNFFPILK